MHYLGLGGASAECLLVWERPLGQNAGLLGLGLSGTGTCSGRGLAGRGDLLGGGPAGDADTLGAGLYSCWASATRCGTRNKRIEVTRPTPPMRLPRADQAIACAQSPHV